FFHRDPPLEHRPHPPPPQRPPPPGRVQKGRPPQPHRRSRPVHRRHRAPRLGGRSAPPAGRHRHRRHFGHRLHRAAGGRCVAVPLSPAPENGAPRQSGRGPPHRPNRPPG